ncbi:hypothetical protein ACFPJ2_12840 [Microbacterium suwonense]
MAEPAAGRATRGGLRHILIATAIAGGIGYLIQLAVPIVAPDAYLDFATMWSATYLVVTCLSGIQQELTRASRRGPAGSGFRTWSRFAITSGITATGLVAVIFWVSGPRLFPAETLPFVGVVALATFGYCLVAAISGAVYGLTEWGAVAGMTVVDAVIRVILIASALLAGGSAILLGWATAVPFLLAALVIWLWVGRRIRHHLVIDVPMVRLFKNSAATVAASLSTGALISGLPMILKAFAPDAGVDLLASFILVITLTRAPLVVPLVALQGYLLVSFRDSAHGSASRILRWTTAVLGVVIVLAVAAAVAGPALMTWLFSGFLILTPMDFALIVLSAGLTGVMCITGPAVLAMNRHAWYTSGWVVSAGATIVVLLLPIEAHTRVVAALLMGPLLGAIVHVIAVARASAPTR